MRNALCRGGAALCHGGGPVRNALCHGGGPVRNASCHGGGSLRNALCHGRACCATRCVKGAGRGGGLCSTPFVTGWLCGTRV